MKKQENKEEDNQYLPEDKKLLDELEKSELFNTGITSEGHKKQLQIMQIKATLRSIKSMKDFDKSTSYFSRLLGLFALIQIVIAIMQFAVSALSLKNILVGFIITLLFYGLLFFIIRSVRKDI